VSASGSRNGILYPLDRAYAQAGVAPPQARRIAPADIPQPYRSLLVHERDMTLTLEQHFGGRVVLRPLSTFSSHASYYRRVLLVQEYSGRPVEMGAIRMKLDAFAPRIRTLIRRNEIPLGRILRDGGVNFLSRPRVFFSITPNPEMMGVFWMREPRPLYGRQTEVLLDERRIGDIVEVLPLV
jgi:chorismate-pyruvate lyase